MFKILTDSDVPPNEIISFYHMGEISDDPILTGKLTKLQKRFRTAVENVHVIKTNVKIALMAAKKMDPQVFLGSVQDKDFDPDQLQWHHHRFCFGRIDRSQRGITAAMDHAECNPKRPSMR